MPNIWSGTRGDGGSSGGAGGVSNPLAADLDQGAFNITSDGGNSVWTVLPTGVAATDTAAIQEALDDIVAAGGGGILQLMAGDYVINAEITYSSHVNDVVIRGVGPQTRIHHNGSFDGHIFNLNSIGILAGNLAINNATKGDTTITMTTHANAAGIQVGDLISIQGTATIDGFLDVESHYVSIAGNASTGVIGLDTPILRTMTSVITFATTQVRGNSGWYVGDMSLILDSASATHSKGILMGNFQNSIINNIECVEGWNLMPGTTNTDAAIILFDSIYCTISNCKVKDAAINGLVLGSPLSCRILNNTFINNAPVNNSAFAHFRSINCSDLLIEGNYFEGSLSSNVIQASGSNPNRRNKIVNNTIRGSRNHGIDLSNAGRDTLIEGNVIQGILDTAIYVTSTSNVIRGNKLIDCTFPIYCQTGALDTLIANNYIQNRTNQGVYLGSGCDRCVVSGNVFKDGGSSAAVIIGVSDNNLITGNFASGASGKGVDLNSGSDNNLVTGNHFIGTSGITDSGTNNDVTNNKLT
jgi:nitrous oxidase accessory protein NosD